jgi:hypothetical protein
LELFRADAERNTRAQQLGSMSYAYPQSLGEWLGTAVKIAATVSWQAHFAVRPLAQQADHERRIADQGRTFIERMERCWPKRSPRATPRCSERSPLSWRCGTKLATSATASSVLDHGA